MKYLTREHDALPSVAENLNLTYILKVYAVMMRIDRKNDKNKKEETGK